MVLGGGGKGEGIYKEGPYFEILDRVVRVKNFMIYTFIP